MVKTKRLFSASLLLATCTLQLSGIVPAQARPRPNVLVIVTDDQRASETLNVMEATQRLFVRGGTKFTNAVATTPLCCPARASIFTGQYAHNHGVRGNEDIANLAHQNTFQRYLGEGGYRTAIFGKLANRWSTKRNPPYFDRWATSSDGRHRYKNGTWNVNGQIRTVEAYASEYIKRKAVRFIRTQESNDRKPWLLYLAPPAPHEPATPQRRYADRLYAPWNGNPAVHEVSRRDKPPYVQRIPPTTFADGQSIRLRQLRTLESVDNMIRRVFQTLKRKSEKRRTLAIFLSDNGYLWGEHKLSEKRHPYIQSSEIPLAIRWPGRVPKGRTSRKFVANIDLAPTILDATNISPRHTMDGRSLLRRWRRSSLLQEHWNTSSPVPTWKSLRTRRMQYIEYYDSDGTRTFREFYNLRRDPWQLMNLLKDGRKRTGPSGDRLHALRLRLERAATCSGKSCR